MLLFRSFYRLRLVLSLLVVFPFCPIYAQKAYAQNVYTQSAREPIIKPIWKTLAKLFPASSSRNKMRTARVLHDHEIKRIARAVSARHNIAKRPAQHPVHFTQKQWNARIPFTKTGGGLYSSAFGWRNLYGKTDFHGGVDICYPPHTTIYTPVAGEVIGIVNNKAHGGIVLYSHGRQYTLWHMTPKRGLKIGQFVKKGEAVGNLANWGSRTHLHYAVHSTGANKNPGARSDKNAMDPLLYHKYGSGTRYASRS